MKKWMVHTKKADFFSLAKQYGIDPVTVRILINRGIRENDFENFLHPDIKNLHDFHLLKDIDVATDIIYEAIRSKEKIRIIGDYDIDGVQSTYILVDGLRRLGANIDYAIPHRIEDGYGLNENLIYKAKEDNVNLVITCDNGIASHTAVQLAKDLHMKIVVTDHHNIPYKDNKGKKEEWLVTADAIVNPKQAGCDFPFCEICGTTVAWHVLRSVYERFKRDENEPFMYLQNVAFATIGDVMPLVEDNRTIVIYGLQQLNHTNNPGMKALIERTLEGKEVKAYHVGFVLGPCINAGGRLETAKEAVELLLEQDISIASARAQRLQELNEERKNLTNHAVEEAKKYVEEKGTLDDILVIYLPNVHESIAGIVAGRIREEYNRPTMVITDGENCAKGSCRSIEGYNIYDGLHEVCDLLLVFGGHPMAAGFSLAPENIPKLSERLNEHSKLTQKDFEETIWIDVPMPLSYISKQLVMELNSLEPFGNGFEKPVFAQKDVKVLRIRYIGKEQSMLKLQLYASDTKMEALYFGNAKKLEEDVKEKFGDKSWDELLQGRNSSVKLSFLYYPQINSYMGQDTLQIIISEYC